MGTDSGSPTDPVRGARRSQWRSAVGLRTVTAAALFAGVLGSVAYAGHAVLGLGGHAAAGVLLAVAFGGMVLACGAAYRGRSGVHVEFALLGVAIAAYGVTAIWYAVLPDAAARFPSVGDVGLLAFYPLAFAALVAFARRHVVGLSGASWLDAALGAVVLATAGAAVVWSQLGGVFSVALAGQLLYLLGDLGLLGFLLAVDALAGWRHGSSLRLLAAGAAALVIADGVWAVQVAHGAGAPGLLSVGWLGGMLLFTVGALREVPSARLSPSLWTMVGFPAVSAAACLPIVLLAATATPHNVLASVALGLVVVRLILSPVENSRLLASIGHAAITDSLTGLANRRLLVDRIEQALMRQHRHGGAVAVLMVDIDDFKAINDAHGHENGDRVLVGVGERLDVAVRGEDTIARVELGGSSPPQRNTVGRLGGDEFVVVLEGLGDPAEAALVAERIRSGLHSDVVVGAHQLVLGASIGIAVARSAGSVGATELLRDSDTAMHAAKRAGNGGYQLFEAEMHREVIARTRLVRDLRGAVNNEQLRLLYQPQVDVSSGRMTGVEALVRWEHPERGLIIPDEFIPTAESTGVIVDIDDWVLREACAQLRRWDDIGLPSLCMAVNVSARRLTTGDLATTVAAVLRDTEVAPERLEIELTETAAIKTDDDPVPTITRIRALGVRAAIDDFGMGHSALSRLRTFPVDRLKIDRSFITPLTIEGARGSIADAMIAIAQSLRLAVLAEGVETLEHLHALRVLGCPAAQGYLFSRPVPAETIERYAREESLLSSLEEPAVLANRDFESSAAKHERLTRNLLAEIQRLTGLETTYLTRIDWDAALQHITHARNTGTLNIPEGLAVDWSDTVCRRALEQGVTYTHDVPATFPDSQAALELGLQTYLSVPLVDNSGDVQGTLCAASSKRVQLGPEAISVMERFAQIISQGVANRSAGARR